MLLRSFGYQKELTPDVLCLFKGISECKDFDSSIEVIDAAMAGRINSDKDFNLAGYDTGVKNNTYMNESKKAGEEVYLDAEEDTYADAVLFEQSAKIDPYEAIFNENEVQSSVTKLLSMRTEFLVDEGVDFIFAIRQALKGIPQAVECLRSLCENYSRIRDHIQIILASGIPFEDLFPEDIDMVLESASAVEVVSEVVAETEAVPEVAGICVLSDEAVSPSIGVCSPVSVVSSVLQYCEFIRRMSMLDVMSKVVSAFMWNRRDGCPPYDNKDISYAIPRQIKPRSPCFC